MFNSPRYTFGIAPRFPVSFERSMWTVLLAISANYLRVIIREPIIRSDYWVRSIRLLTSLSEQRRRRAISAIIRKRSIVSMLHVGDGI